MSTEWISKIFERPDETPQEGADSKPEAVGAPLLLAGDKTQKTPGSATLITQKAKDEDAKAPKATMHLKGEYSPPLPADVQDERQLISQKEINFSEAQSFTRLNAGRALAQTKAQAQEILAEDYQEMDRLNKEHYSRWETENEQFRADIDAARQLRVNPNNYMQSIGRSGRVSSVLAAAASQMAAGAGNPNMAWNRIKATIDQDITTQKANIELEFAGIEAAQGQQNREAEMLSKYYGFEEKSRAVAMTALEAQVAIIQQRAANEMEYQAYQMIRDRARAEAIDASAAALAKNATLYLDAPTHRAYQALINGRKWQEAQAMLQEAYAQEVGAAEHVDTGIQTYDESGQPVMIDTPEAQPLGPVVGGPESPVGAAPAPAAARVARDKRPREAGASPEEQAATPETEPQQTPTSEEARPLTPQEADMERRLGPVEGQAPEGIALPADAKAEKKAKADAEKKAADEEKDLRIRARAAEVEKGIRQRMTDEVINAGGYRFVDLANKGMVPQDYNRFTEARDILLDPTDPEIAVFASYADAKEGLKYDNRTGPQATYERKHPELFEQLTFQEYEGTKTKPRWIESNYVTTGWGDIKLSRTSSYRHDQDKREEFADAVNTDLGRAEEIANQAEAVQKYGSTNIFGLQITDDGLVWPGSPGSAEALQTKEGGLIGLGIQAMKLLDPSGRLTDKDIEVGKQYVSAVLANPAVKTWDMFSRIYRSVTGKEASKGDLQRSLGKTLAKMATKLSDAVAKKHINHIVLNFDQHTKFSEGRARTEAFMRAEDK